MLRIAAAAACSCCCANAAAFNCPYILFITLDGGVPPAFLGLPFLPFVAGVCNAFNSLKLNPPMC